MRRAVGAANLRRSQPPGSGTARDGFCAEGDEGNRLARDDLLQATGTVEKILGGGRYKIELDGGQVVTAQLSGRMRRFRIRVLAGDRVSLAMSPYDLTRGRITFRHK